VTAVMLLLAAVTIGEGVTIGGAIVGIGTLLGFLAKYRSERDAIVRDAVAAAIAQSHPKEHHVGGQPIGIRTDHPCVPQPDFDGHKKEMWEVVNGLRMAISRIESSIAEIKALREANAARLSEISREFNELTKQVSRMAGALEHVGKTTAQRRT
jgi:hypothetical protein